VTAVTEAHYDEQFDINSKGAYFTHTEGAALSERWRFNHPEHQRSQPPGTPDGFRVRRNQGSHAFAHAFICQRAGRAQTFE